jgi:hypothetical protein
MENKVLAEGLSYMDMEHQVVPLLGIDQFKSTIGSDEELVTINFIVRSKACADDLVDWLERGYDWIVDADTSPGEISNGKYYVFADMNRRKSIAGRIMEMLADLETLTGFKASDWSVKIGDERYRASQEVIEEHVALTPHEYRESHDGELNEWRDIAGIKAVPLFDTRDQDLLAIQRQAGIK